MISGLKILADGGVNWGDVWTPVSRSTVAPEIDAIFWGIMWTCVFFFLLVTTLLVVFAIKYRARPGIHNASGPKHNTAAELTWTFVPTVIVTIIFVYGFKEFMVMAVPPPDPYEVYVQASMWHFSFQYPNNHLDEELHIPINTPVQFVLNSSDVLHGFFMPVFRMKKDVVPGRYNKIWVQATEVGTYDIFCTQYCGQGHSTMRAHVIVQTLDDFKKWLSVASVFKGTPAEHGKYIWQTRGCNQCHSIDGTTNKCPTWKDLFGSDVKLQDGTTVLADENYLFDVISKPNSKPIPGFEKIMPPTLGLVTDPEIHDVIKYVQTLSSHYHPPALPTTEATTQAADQPSTQPAAQ